MRPTKYKAEMNRRWCTRKYEIKPCRLRSHITRNAPFDGGKPLIGASRDVSDWNKLENI